MALENEVELDIAGEYSAFPNGDISTEYNSLVELNYPFRLRYLITKNGVRHMRKWYFAANGEFATKTEYNLERMLARRYINWNPTMGSMGGIWNRIIGNVTQSFTSVPIPPFMTEYTLNPKLQIEVDNSEARASFSNGYTSGTIMFSIYLNANATRDITIGFYNSVDGTDLGSTDNFIAVTVNSTGELIVKNSQTNETTSLGIQGDIGLNLGITLNINTGEWLIVDTGYFSTSGTTNFNITEKVYPFVIVSSPNQETVDVIVKTELNETGASNATVVYPSVPSMFSLPNDIIIGKRYRVIAANQFSNYQNQTLYLNDVVEFDELNNMTII